MASAGVYFKRRTFELTDESYQTQWLLPSVKNGHGVKRSAIFEALRRARWQREW
jgi:hypothetical protein